MKTILLIRHGEADAARGLPDRERPLTAKGKKQALEMAELVAGQELLPDLVVASPARRAVETARAMAGIWHYDENGILKESLLYEGGIEACADVLDTLPEPYCRVALVAHNPAIGYLAAQFSMGEVEAFPPCGVVAFRVRTEDWSGCYTALKQMLLFAVPGA